MQGLFYGDPGQLGAQAISVVVNFIWAWGAMWLIFSLVKRFVKVRVDPEVEIAGLDEGEFGQFAYPDFLLRTETDTGIEHQLDVTVGASQPKTLETDRT